MMQNSAKNKVRHVQIGAEHAGRRIDNFLISQFKGIPKTRFYQMLRKGEVRVNSARIKQDHRLQMGDKVRIPPLYTAGKSVGKKPPEVLQKMLENSIIYDEDDLLVLNKPAGLVVHGGSRQEYGIIETLRMLKPETPLLELVHRLDKDTSGCLLIAKDHRMLRVLHEALRAGRVKKNYLALLKGRLPQKQLDVDLPLKKSGLQGGERMVHVAQGGKQAQTNFKIVKYYKNACLARVQLITGRTHQIRVHAAQIGHYIAGDVKYGERDFNKRMKKTGLKRLFLHAESIQFISPSTGKLVKFEAPLDDELQQVLFKFKE